jgi:hypothetical protein
MQSDRVRGEVSNTAFLSFAGRCVALIGLNSRTLTSTDSLACDQGRLLSVAQGFVLGFETTHHLLDLLSKAYEVLCEYFLLRS